jgi:hypothetical protein
MDIITFETNKKIIKKYIFGISYGAMTLSTTTLSIMTFSVTTLRIQGLYVTLSISDIQQNNTLPFCRVSLCSVPSFNDGAFDSCREY